MPQPNKDLREYEEMLHAYGLDDVDWVILAPTRWKLRKAFKTVNETLAEL